MSQDRLSQMVISIMLLAGFDVSERCNIRPRSFDLIAKKGDTLVTIKVVSHIDSITADTAWDLNLIARCLEATPLIIGERARDTDLERGVVYIRYGLFAISPETLYDYLVEGNSPMVYADSLTPKSISKETSLHTTLIADCLIKLSSPHL